MTPTADATRWRRVLLAVPSAGEGVTVRELRLALPGMRAPTLRSYLVQFRRHGLVTFAADRYRRIAPKSFVEAAASYAALAGRAGYLARRELRAFVVQARTVGEPLTSLAGVRIVEVDEWERVIREAPRLPSAARAFLEAEALGSAQRRSRTDPRPAGTLFQAEFHLSIQLIAQWWARAEATGT